MNEAKLMIESGPKYLDRFKDVFNGWLTALEAHRDKIEIACGVQQIAETEAAGVSYSYEKGHLTEFDVQVMIKDIVTTLKTPPGRRMTKAQKRAVKEKRQAR